MFAVGTAEGTQTMERSDASVREGCKVVPNLPCVRQAVMESGEMDNAITKEETERARQGVLRPRSQKLNVKM